MAKVNLGRVVGPAGQDGRKVLLQATSSYIQWKYEGDDEWQNLIALSLLKGADGAPGQPGQPGQDGQDGRGIRSIEKVSTSGLVDTYVIYYTDNTMSTFQVTNGKDGSGSGLNIKELDINTFIDQKPTQEDIIDVLNNDYQAIKIILGDTYMIMYLQSKVEENDKDYYFRKEFAVIDGTENAISVAKFINNNYSYDFEIDVIDLSSSGDSGLNIKDLNENEFIDDRPTDDKIQDILNNNYDAVRILSDETYNTYIISSYIEDEDYLKKLFTRIDIKNEVLANIKFSYDKGTYSFDYNEIDVSGGESNVTIYEATFDMSHGEPELSQEDLANIYNQRPDILKLYAGTTTTIGYKNREDSEDSKLFYSAITMEDGEPTVYIIKDEWSSSDSEYIFEMYSYSLDGSGDSNISVYEFNETDLGQDVLSYIFNNKPDLLKITTEDSTLQDYCKGQDNEYYCIIEGILIRLLITEAKGSYNLEISRYDLHYIQRIDGVNDGTNWTSITIGEDTYNIPSEITEQIVANWGFTKNTGTYSKPNSGIPKTDLAEDVQTSLGKADTALQEHQSLSGYQTLIDSSHKLDSDLVDDTNNTNKFVTEQDKQNWNNKGTYSKPSGGIPKTDLSGSVQTSLEKADTALQEHQSLDNYYTKTEVDSKVSSVYKYKGTVTTYGDLPDTDLTIGDVYNVEADGSNYAWTGTTWDKLGGDIDLSGYQTKIDSSHKLDSDLVDDTNKTNKFVTTQEKENWNNKGTYSKPSGGIPENDLSSDVQASLGKADTALQEHQDLSGYQTLIDSSHKLSSDLVDDTNNTNKFVTEQEKQTWNNKGNYSKPSGGIPETDLSSEVQTKLNVEIADVILDSNLVGKKLSLLGDSITTYQGWLPSGNVTRYPRGAITSVEQTWWKKLLNATGMVIGQNCAWDGSTCSGLSTSTTNAYAGCSDKRISQLGLNGTPDIIICYIGINDWGATYNKNHTQYGGSFVDGAFVPVGDYTGEAALPSGELKTFSEAYGCMIGKIQNQYPNAKIYCCTLPQTNGKTTYNYDADGVFPSINRDGVSIADYNDCIRMLANNFGVEIIEFAKCGINWGNMTTYMEDGLHPRPDGMTLLANTAKAKLYSDFGVSVHGGSPTPSTNYTITNNLTHVTTNNNATTIAENASYIATLTAESTYNLQSVTVTMGGTDITATAYNNGTITIVNVTGNLVITATATAQASYSVTNNLTNVTTSNNTASVIENSSYSATLSPAAHYTMGTVTVTMGGVDITSTAYDDGDISIASVTGNLVITATGNAITYTVTNNLTNATNSNSDTSTIEGSNYTGTITPDTGYMLDSVTVEMGGVDITSTAYSNGTINIASVTGNIVITVTTQEIQLTWYTNFAQTSTSSFVTSSKGWALDETTYANAYGKPINKISFVATANSGSMDFCIAPAKDAQSGFTNVQTINWDSSNKSGNIVTIDIPEFTLENGKYLCVYVNSSPATGAACYANGGTAGQFYSYVGNSSHSTWGNKGAYSIQMNLGYDPTINNA